MKLSLIAFTAKGRALAQRLIGLLEGGGHTFVDKHFEWNSGAGNPCFLRSWTACAWAASDGLIFIGATGIAVRAIAPFVQDKLTDPAIVSIDELGHFVVPLLGGHIGGANALARELAALLGATPVISTATDLNNKIAIDLWMAERGLFLCERELAKAVSAALLDGKEIGFYSDFAQHTPPRGFVPTVAGELGVCVSFEKKQIFTRTLHAIPRVITLGVGCRRGVADDAFEHVLLEVIAENHIAPEAVAQLATIDLKRDEPCIRAFCEKYHLSLLAFPADVLARVPGSFTASDFVRRTTGVDNVCERAAVLAAAAPLIFPKTARNAVTVAAAGTMDAGDAGKKTDAF